SSRRRHTRFSRDWSSDVCSSDLKIFLSKLLPEDISQVAIGTYGAVQKIAIFLSIFVQAFRLGAEPFFFSHAKNPNSGKTYALIRSEERRVGKERRSR